MNDFDVPIFKKVYELYKEFYLCLADFPRQHKYSLGQKCESLILEIIALILRASQAAGIKKLQYLEEASVRLNILRVNLRLAQDIKALTTRRYLAIQLVIDEIGRMLGGWIKTVKNKT